MTFVSALIRRKQQRRLMRRLKKIAAFAFLVFVVLSSSLKPVAAQEGLGGKIIGIDLGTTQSVVSFSYNGNTEIIPNEQGNRITPSMVAFASDEILIGDTAYNQLGRNPRNTIFDVKRFIGRTFDDPTVQRDIKLLPFDVVNKNNKPYFKVTYQGAQHEFSAEEISSMILRKLKETAEAYLGETIKKVVVTVPAHFDDAQKQATKDAGTIAGLDVVRIINEPTSAAIAFGIDRQHTGRESNVIIYDLGGGTFDVSLLALDDGIFEVISTGGDSHLGGEDFDENVVKYMMKQFKKKFGVDIRDNDRALGKLRRECEKAKRALSSAKQTKIEIENLAEGYDLSEMLTRARFEDLNSKLFRKTMKPLEQVLADSGLKKNQIDEIVLVGGSTRIPKIQEMVQKFFNGKTPNRGINPDEAVAFGASIQAAMLGDHWCEPDDPSCGIVIVDAASLSLGIETVGGIMTTIIDRGTNYPVSKSKVFSTNQDNQDSVYIQVFQGERAQTKDNRKLGQFMLTGIPAQPRGVPQIDVKFEIDVNGLLQVEAYEKSMGDAGRQSIVIQRDDHNLSQEEIDEIVERAERFAHQDEDYVKRTQAKQQLEQSVFGLKSKLYDKQDEMDQDLFDELMEMCNEMTEWIDDNADAEYEDYTDKQQEFDEMARSFLGSQESYPHQDEDDSYSDHEDL